MTQILKVPKVKEFCPSRASWSNDHPTEGCEEPAQFCFEDEYEDDDENDANQIVNPTRPRTRPR
jgi:hypothetical protein